MTFRILEASLLVVAMAGCGETVTAPPPGPAPGGHSDASIAACAALYDSYVAWAKACTAVEPARAGIEDLAAACAQRAALPGIDLPAATILSCSAKVAVASCAALPLECLTPLDGYEDSRGAWLTDVVSSIIEGGAIFELFPRTKGTLKPGEACDLRAQCASGTCGPGQACGVCLEVKSQGEACGGTAICEYGILCDSGTCVDVRPGLGEACSIGAKESGAVCRGDLYCDGEMCRPRLSPGQACTGVDSSECFPGAICDGSICQASTLGEAGVACDDVAARCVEGTFCQEGICHVPVANGSLGDACGVDVCGPGLNCAFGACGPPSKPGDSCQYWEQCGGGNYCGADADYGGFHCAVPRREGEPCIGLPYCEIGLFCDVTTDRCKRNLEAGSACSDSTACRWPSYCRDGVCSELFCSAR